MGSAVSTFSSGHRVTSENNEYATMTDESASRSNENECDEEFHDTTDEDVTRVKVKEDEMEQFKKQLQVKREQRREILDRHRSEKEELVRTLESERKAKLEAIENNKILRNLLIQNNIEIPKQLQPEKETIEITKTILHMNEEFEKLKNSNNRLRRNLTEANSTLQRAYSDIAELNSQHTQSIKQISALREVVACSKTMIKLREQQIEELKDKLGEIERSLADREASMLSSDLRQEYERQLQNIRTLRGLYEERARLAEITRQGLLRDIEEQKRLKQVEMEKCKNLASKVAELEEKVDELLEKIENKNSEIALFQGETQSLQAEMSVINKLFSQVLLGYRSKQDLDKLIHRLKENHGLLTHMAEKEDGSEASTALPKLLLEIVTQIEDIDENKESDHFSSSNDKNLEITNVSETNDKQDTAAITAEEIVQYLPKVWKVLKELLSHQNTPEQSDPQKVTTCYKSVETKNGPVLVPSVSQTYIRLKDLIVEKLSLVKEVNRMKQLNAHLETRLEEQERKLSLVTTELSKTWHVVGRLRRHHHQLHTHEKILKYELQQKRKLLNELKEELEYCREKWEQAREKNTQSERDLKKLRLDFANRKKTNSATFNTSAESGYSDERPSDDSSESNDESEYAAERLIRTKKKMKKSFETVLDSSTDFNLAAEREDPASDMLDVADLPLDTQDIEEISQQYPIGISTSESTSQSHDNVCDETEDEALDITHDSCLEDTVNAEQELPKQDITEKEIDKETNVADNVNTACPQEIVSINPATILQSIKEQNERLAKKDKKLDSLEKSTSILLATSTATANISSQIDSTLDHILNRTTVNRNIETPSTSANTFQEINVDENMLNRSANDMGAYHNKVCNKTEDKVLYTTQDSYVKDVVNAEQEVTNKGSTEKEIDRETHVVDKLNDACPQEIVSINPAAILQSIREQNERLAKKDKKLENLEKESSMLLAKAKTTANISSLVDSTLDHLLNRPTVNRNREVISTSANTSEEINVDENVQNQSENYMKPSHDEIYGKTEDKVSNTTQDSYVKDSVNAELELTKKGSTEKVTDRGTHVMDVDKLNDAYPQEIVYINPAAILQSIKEQNERLDKKDKKLENLEKESSMVLDKAKTTANISLQIDSTLNHILYRPTVNRDSEAPSTSANNFEEISVDENALHRGEYNTTTSHRKANVKHNSHNNKLPYNSQQIEDQSFQQINKENLCASQTEDKSQEIHFKNILENTRKQDERLVQRDERFKSLDTSCSNIVENITDTITLGNTMLKKLDNIHGKEAENPGDTSAPKESGSTSEVNSQPSTSCEIDHEARFAARDLRLKMLEEQTKSLVNKVNKTTSKGVKIHYKLEELHNIYGSEGSRGGSPEDEDKNNENDSNDSNF